ncbi:MAG: hypothetical protein RL693_1330, partial [Verrucomicrobiota bacterium]
MKQPSPRTHTQPMKPILTHIFALLAPVAALHAALPPDYRGTPFDDASYRAEQEAKAAASSAPRQEFKPALHLWDSKAPKLGSGWIYSAEPEAPKDLDVDRTNATIDLDEADSEGRRFIHFHEKGLRHSTIFGVKWATPQEPAVDFRKFDAISFVIKITGPKLLKELYFGITDHNPTPVSIRNYDSNFTDGEWHTITIPLEDLKWSAVAPTTDQTDVRAVSFMTYLWEASDYDVLLDHFTLDHRSTPLETAEQATPTTVVKVPAAKAQSIPGRIECAFFDLGGEGLAYHDTDAINALSGVLNQEEYHHRQGTSSYHWNFRKDEGVDLSFTKDFADFKHNQNMVVPPANQFYIGCARAEEWCNYTVEVKAAGTYRIWAMYGGKASPFKFSINHGLASEHTLPVETGSAHKWNRGEVGTITFPEAGLQL